MRYSNAKLLNVRLPNVRCANVRSPNLRFSNVRPANVRCPAFCYLSKEELPKKEKLMDYKIDQ